MQITFKINRSNVPRGRSDLVGVITINPYFWLQSKNQHV
jgi:hypothetical protein